MCDILNILQDIVDYSNMYPERVRAVNQEITGLVIQAARGFWRFTKEHAKDAGVALLIACSPQPPQEQTQKPQEPQLPKDAIVLQVTNTPEPKREPTATPTKEPTPTPEPPKFLEFIPFHAVYLGNLMEQRDKEVKAGEILITRLHDERIFVKTTRFRTAPCAEGALRIVNLPMAEDPTQFRKRPGVTAKAIREEDKFIVQQGGSKLVFNENRADLRSIEGELQFLIPASGQKLCPDGTFKAQFQVAGTQPLIETIAAMNKKADREPGIEYATQSLKAVSVIQGEELPIIPKQKDLIPFGQK